MYKISVKQAYADDKLVDYISIYWLPSTSTDDLWKTKLEMKDWLQDQFGLNRGYTFYYNDQTFETNVWFDNDRDLMLFKMVFG